MCRAASRHVETGEIECNRRFAGERLQERGMITMAFCYNCGSPLGDADKFCASCGAAVIGQQPAGDDRAAAAPETGQPDAGGAQPVDAQPEAAREETAFSAEAPVVPEPPQDPVTPAAGEASVPPVTLAAGETPAQPVPPAGPADVPPTPQQPPQSFTYQQSVPQPPQDFSYQQVPQGSIPAGQTMVTPPIVPAGGASPLSRAWSDFKASPGKVKIILKLATFQFVPGVGGLVLSGYAYTWAKEQAFGKHDPMPQKIIRPGVLDSGLYAYGTSLILSVATFVAFLILGALLGAVRLGGLMFPIWLAYIIVAGPFFSAMYLRSAICGKVRAGLNFGRARELFSTPGKVGPALAAYWGPAAAGLGLGIVVASVLLIVFGLMMGGAFISLLTVVLMAAMGAILPLIVVLLFALFFIGTAVTMVTARAFGYWMQDFNPRDWPEYQENARYYQESVL